jgi:hypothetical protein
MSTPDQRRVMTAAILNSEARRYRQGNLAVCKLPGVPRHLRGSRTVLSNHAFGSAFNRNERFNKLGQRPALVEGRVASASWCRSQRSGASTGADIASTAPTGCILKWPTWQAPSRDNTLPTHDNL